MYSKEKNTVNAWLSLLGTNSLEDAEHLIADYPWMEEIYEEIDEKTAALAQKDDALAQQDDKIKELTAMIEELKKTAR